MNSSGKMKMIEETKTKNIFLADFFYYFIVVILYFCFKVMMKW
jgi:hypothetical protein